MILKVAHQNIQQRTIKLAQSFIQHGQSPTNESNYTNVYLEMVELMQGVANKVGKKKFGYAHPPELTPKGQMVLVHKQIMYCKNRQTPPTEALCTHTKEQRNMG